MAVTIVNNRVAGTRITVYDVYYYLVKDTSRDEIGEILRLTPEQVHAAIEYIDQHKAEVHAVHERIEERNARGNPPEIEAKREASRAKLQAWLKERQQAGKQEENGAGNPGGC
jgi:uncharacterized protein (DUF433 family)